jgi:putative spermidine/putrescine transport system permease protein
MSAARALTWGLVGLIVLLLVAPILIVIPVSFSSGQYLQFPPPGWSLEWYRSFFDDPSWVAAVWTSVRVAATTTVVSTVLGTLAAMALVRWAGRGRALANTLLMTPLIVPVIIFAAGAYAMYLQVGLVGSVFGLVLGHTVLALPFVVVNVAAPLRTLDRNLELAAQSLGASPAQTLRTVTLPLIAPGVLAGALFAFITSFDEVVLALFVTTPQTQTLPVKMWSSIQLDLDPTIAAASSLMIVSSTLVLALAGVLTRRAR